MVSRQARSGARGSAPALSRYGFPVRQIVTGGTCHLDARTVDGHLDEFGISRPGPSVH